MILKAIIVEDEKASRETLENYIQKYCPNVKLMAAVDSIKSGLAAIHLHQPDVVFLDVEMPFGNAFDLLEQVDKINFETVFVTAFSNYAVRALNISASYYILKPVNIGELIAAVEKITESKKKSNDFLHTKILVDNLQTTNKQLHKIVLPMLNGFEVVQVKDIVRCEANDNLTDFILADGSKKVICRTLKHFEEVLVDFNFLRVHKSHLVNLEYVKQYKKGKGGVLVLSNGNEIEVSISRKDELLDKFS